MINVSGTRISLAAAETALVVGTSTEVLGMNSQSGTDVGLNGTGGSLAYTGGADRRLTHRSPWLELFMAALGLGIPAWL